MAALPPPLLSPVLPCLPHCSTLHVLPCLPHKFSLCTLPPASAIPSFAPTPVELVKPCF